MKLTKMIFDYWKHWMGQPKGCPVHTDGVFFPSHSKYPSVQFWWVLNIGWYEMNNKSLAITLPVDAVDKFKFVCPEDFEGLV
jgi:hypothetical protein